MKIPCTQKIDLTRSLLTDGVVGLQVLVLNPIDTACRKISGHIDVEILALSIQEMMND